MHQHPPPPQALDEPHCSAADTAAVATLTGADGRAKSSIPGFPGALDGLAP
jgi:hypothetical protein